MKVVCSRCNTSKEVSEYYWDKTRDTIRYKFCKECFVKKQKKKRQSEKQEFYF